MTISIGVVVAHDLFCVQFLYGQILQKNAKPPAIQYPRATEMESKPDVL